MIRSVTWRSGPAAGGAGVATANADSPRIISGRIVAVGIKYIGSPPATTDVTLATKGTIGPVYNIHVVTNGNTDKWVLPRLPTVNASDAAITYDGTRPVHDAASVLDYLNAKIDQANNNNEVEYTVLYEELY